MKKVTVTTFTDPMMGLSYECEPVFRKLETHYGDRIEFRCRMAGLVRDVSDFMTFSEREETRRDTEAGIRLYCRRLARIYKSEEAISGMPINMEGFHLFDADHRSSWPLNISYEAAKLIDPEKADLFLYNLRYATIVETRQTTREEEILNVAETSGFDRKDFEEAFHGKAARAAFQEDMKYTRSLGIYSLPAYLLQFGNESILINAMIDFDSFVQAVGKLTKHEVMPENPVASESSVCEFLARHPLISRIELREAFNLSAEKVEKVLQPLFERGRIEEAGEFVYTIPAFPIRECPDK